MPKFLPLLLIVLLAAAGGYYFLGKQNSPTNPNSGAPIALPQGYVCDSETMTCSDGTVLKKQPPNCSFPPCPSGSSAASSAIPVGESVTVSGTMICLPHKNSSGSQTMECAFGLKGDDGNNYGLTDPNWKYLTGVSFDKKVEIKGKLTKKPDQKYDSAGVIEIEFLSEK